MKLLQHKGVQFVSIAAITSGVIFAPKLIDFLKMAGRYASAPDTAEAAYQLASDTRYDFDKYLEIQEKIQQVQLETARQMQQYQQSPRERIIERQDRYGDWWCSYDEVDWWRC